MKVKRYPRAVHVALSQLFRAAAEVIFWEYERARFLLGSPSIGGMCYAIDNVDTCGIASRGWARYLLSDELKNLALEELARHLRENIATWSTGFSSKLPQPSSRDGVIERIELLELAAEYHDAVVARMDSLTPKVEYYSAWRGTRKRFVYE